MPRKCVCGKEIPFDETVGPVSMMDPFKVYRHGAEFGKPYARRKIFFCDVHTLELLDVIRNAELQDDT